jgi:hypothetical protein
MSESRRRAGWWLAFAVVALLIGVLPQSAAATTGWTLQQTPNVSSKVVLSDVDCSSSSECVSVGSSENEFAISQRWSNAEWSSLSNGAAGVLTDVSCASSTSCIAISTTMMAQRWTGSEWKSATAASPAESLSSNLYSVSCTSSTFCLAVGTYTLAGGKTRTLAEEWNGEKWTVLGSPFEEGGVNALYAVSCPSSTTCTAIGLKGGKAIALRWTGAEWTTLGEFKETPNTLADISCYSATWCWAVPGGSAKLVRWEGAKWVVATVSPPSGGSAVSLRGVSCATISGCRVVGSYANEGKTLTLGAKWVLGTTWSVEATPNLDGVGVLAGIDCSGTSECMAAGYSQPVEKGPSKTLATRYGAAPGAVTGEAWKVGATEFKVTGAVNPEGLATKYYFEYGTTASYGTKVPLSGEEVGSGTESVAVEKTLAGLKTNTTYHFRVVAYSNGGTSYGGDETFKVPSATRYWYVGGEKLAPSTPMGIKANGTKNFVIQWKLTGVNFEVTCTTQTSKESTIENPAKEAAGVATVKLLLSGCTINQPSSCTVNTPIELGVAGAATEVEGVSAVKFTGTMGPENTIMTVNLSGAECPYKSTSFLFKGSFTGIANNATSSLEFSKANSAMTMAGEKATLEGTSKIETTTGKTVSVAP